MSDNKIAFAERVARFMHMNQVDKAGVPYIDHIKSVVRQIETSHMRTDVAVIAGWLHDTVEDTSLTLESIHGEFGAEVAEVVRLLTRWSGQSDFDYYQAIKQNPDAYTVKLADLLDNTRYSRLSLLPQDVQERLRAKYSYAVQELLSNAR